MKKLISLILAMMLLLTALPVYAEDDTIFDPTITVAVLGDKTVSELYEDDIWAAMASILLLIDYISSPVGAQDQLDNYSLTDVFVGIDTLDDGTLIFNALFPQRFRRTHTRHHDDSRSRRCHLLPLFARRHFRFPVQLLHRCASHRCVRRP